MVIFARLHDVENSTRGTASGHDKRPEHEREPDEDADRGNDGVERILEGRRKSPCVRWLVRSRANRTVDGVDPANSAKKVSVSGTADVRIAGSAGREDFLIELLARL